MDARKYLYSLMLRKGLGFVAWQAVVFALAWYLHFQLNWGKFFSDILFLIGVFELGIGLMILIGAPAGVPGGQMATFAPSAKIGGATNCNPKYTQIYTRDCFIIGKPRLLHPKAGRILSTSSLSWMTSTWEK